MADAALTVGANKEEIAAVVTTATAVLTRKWSNKSEVTSATISAPM
jgi:alkylhydroperoxidase/carboxymuconolactone decarboxylase family protein YurZ